MNQDTLKTKAKCLSFAQEALQCGHSVVVDSTNSTVESRRDWVALGRQKNAEVLPFRNRTFAYVKVMYLD